MGPGLSSGKSKQYWKELAEQRPASEELVVIALSSASTEATRRDFLSLMGFTLTAAGLTGCTRAPVQKAIPLLVGSDKLVPGEASWFATTCGGCPSACTLLAKTRDGRPIKIEGNSRSPVFGGGTCATGQATVLSLYDDERLRGPLWKGQSISWNDLDEHILDGLRSANRSGREVVLLSETIVGPSTRDIINRWKKTCPKFNHVVYDAVSLGGLRAAHEECFGRSLVPQYRFDKARTIVGLETDFLGTWLSPVGFTHQYAANRKPEGRLFPSRHFQFESGFSVTGSNADLRIPIAPSELGAVAVALLRRVTQKSGTQGCPSEPPLSVKAETLETVATELWRHRGESLVVTGTQDIDAQIVVAALNVFLGNIGKTLDIDSPSFQRTGNDIAMSSLVDDMERGKVGALILWGVNPGYDYPEADRFLKALDNVALSVSFADRRDETSLHVHGQCPDHHFLEAWGDAEPIDSNFSLRQPTIAPLFNTRAAQESLLRWIGETPDYYAYLRAYWENTIFPRQSKFTNFETFWDSTLGEGCVSLPAGTAQSETEFTGRWEDAARRTIKKYEIASAMRREDRYELQLYESVGLRDGRHANNPWLQELPDPISKVTWGNFAAVAPSMAKRLGLHEGDIVRITTENARIELPVFIQPGQEGQTISVALGYGRKQVGKAGQNVGTNAYSLVTNVEGFRQYSAANVIVEKTDRRDDLAATQTHFSLEGRPIIEEMTVAEFHQRRAASPAPNPPSLWPPRPQGDHSWGMVIDLSSCTGCSACVIACQAENNIAVVGKDQIQRTREMHWIRIDRYYSGDEGSPASVHQPMMCQHCGRAPCETVCPVLATTHSSDGLNQQVYNRCIGTRYCANNCPYKVRRFNWLQYADNPKFDFDMESPLGRMVLNPDVTVRSRGVMEKCSLCVQRIQAGKLAALQQGRPLVDGDIQTACQQACPAEAIVFGDLKDPKGRASQLRNNNRYYSVLEDLGTLPNVGYLSKVRNVDVT